jgi:hypothetical protein
MKTFPCEAFGDKNDYSGFDKAGWGARDLDKHREKAYQHNKATTKAGQK